MPNRNREGISRFLKPYKDTNQPRESRDIEGGNPEKGEELESLVDELEMFGEAEDPTE
jgi:hypothetical protein